MTRFRRYTLATVIGLAASTMALAQQGSRPADSSGAMAAEVDRIPQVGQVLDPALLHRISRPGLYGIGQPMSGSDYGVIGGRLIRYDAGTLQVQAVIRQIDGIRD